MTYVQAKGIKEQALDDVLNRRTPNLTQLALGGLVRFNTTQNDIPLGDLEQDLTNRGINVPEWSRQLLAGFQIRASIFAQKWQNATEAEKADGDLVGEYRELKGSVGY